MSDDMRIIAFGKLTSSYYPSICLEIGKLQYIYIYQPRFEPVSYGHMSEALLLEQN
jgi:hypothetical protein